jgi:hypothetical protein
VCLLYKKEPEMARYLLTVPHTYEDCVAELDSVFGHSKELLARFDWGCKAGEHVGWVIIEAASPEVACSMLPLTVRHKATARAINKFSPEDIKGMHTGQ